MPILPKEPDVYPPDLLERAGADEPCEATWWGLYTLARREKELMRRLRAMHVPFYCPLVPRRSRTPKGRICVSHVPLFASYVFLYGNHDDRRQALSTNCVARCLPVVDASQLIHDLRQIHQLIESGAPILPESRLHAGMRVRIRSGVLAGLEGVVIRRQGEERLLVSVSFLQRGASALLEDCQVERIDA